MSQKKVLSLILASWCLASVLGLCNEILRATNQKHNRSLQVIVFRTTFFLVLVVLVSTYSYILVTIYRLNKQKRIQLQSSPLTNTKDNHLVLRDSHMKSVCTSLLFIATFIILWLPNLLIEMLIDYVNPSHLTFARAITLIITMLTAIADFLIYYIRLKRLSPGKLCTQIRNDCSCTSRDARRTNSGQSHLTTTNISMDSSLIPILKEVEESDLVRCEDLKSKPNELQLI